MVRLLFRRLDKAEELQLSNGTDETSLDDRLDFIISVVFVVVL